MTLYLCVALPLFVVAFLCKHCKERMQWFHYVVPVLVTLSVIVISKFAIEKAQTSTTEWWTGWALSAAYDESWTETYYVTVDDGKGRSHVEARTTWHPPEYHVHESNGIAIACDHATYNSFVGKFGNQKTTHPWRSGQSSWGDGRRHTTNWNGEQKTFTPCTTTLRYENRIVASNSIFKFPTIDPKERGLFDYPRIAGYYDCPSVLPASAEERFDLDCMNARLGKIKEVRVWLLVFEGKPLQAGYDQEAYWQGGNMNEIVIAVGIKSDKTIDWCHCFSWTDRQELTLGIRDHVSAMGKLDVKELVKWLEPEIREKFVRKDFHEFDYLTVEPPLWALLLVFSLLLAANGGWLFFCVRPP